MSLGELKFTETEVGSEKWFEQEARTSLHQIGDGLWDLSDSALLYTDKGMAGYKAIQKEETQYSQQVTKVEHRLIRDIAPGIASRLPDAFSYVDIGPGTEHKEKYFFDAFNQQGKNFDYLPIDVNSAVLNESSQFARANGIASRSIHMRFEDSANILPYLKDKTNFISLGATYANFESAEIITKLLKLAGEKGSVFITAQLRDRINLTETVQSYQTLELQEMCRVKLELLGLKDQHIENLEVNDGIEIVATIKDPTPELKAKGMKAGDRILVLKSHRYTLDQLTKDLSALTDFQLYDTGQSFVGILFWQKS